MAETSGIILFILWYIGIAYNYFRDRKENEHSYSARTSEISLLAKADENEEPEKGNLSDKTLILDEVPVVSTFTRADVLEPAVEHAESTIRDAVEEVHAIKETVEEFDVEEVNPDEITDED